MLMGQYKLLVEQSVDIAASSSRIIMWSSILLLLVVVVASQVNAKCRVGHALTASQKQAILNAHNDARRKATARSGAAANMFELKWNDNLAKRAQDWANDCKRGHRYQDSCTGTHLGQNLYYSYNSRYTSSAASTMDVTMAVASWDGEKKDYTYSSLSCAAGKVCGHHTQVVWANSKEIGCGIKYCPNGITNLSWPSGVVIACNYDPPGNYYGQKPYNTGAAGSQCRNGKTSDGKLCKH